ncbi:Spb1 C-terminal domain-containing protein [Lipomyces kononenkoae]|uniref:Spb1 C-terminal domain-containing protein n=1 Tax=Lipomyces kononenkoae TaxID=34357 RepID=A0ACC3SW97_LIPKO
MGKTQKKFGKGRLDQYYRLAKEKGYRARAAFKILQINQKYGGFLEKSKVVIDLCAAPGSWCQVAASLCPVESLIVGVDLAPIKPIPKVITFQEDITSDRCRAQLRQHLKTWKADCVLHDGAPNVGTAWVQDAYTQSELVLQSLKLATEFLVPGGIFVTKVFRSKDYNNLMWVFNQLFTKVDATKPPASRNVSAEIFVVCRGFKAPKRIDPKFLDPRAVFEDLTDPTPNYEAKVFNPEKKKRKRDGYEEGDYTQFKTMSVLDFIKQNDPITALGSMSELKFDVSDIVVADQTETTVENNEATDKTPTPEELNQELKTVKKLEETSKEIKELCRDLKVIGKKDFRLLLKWRLKCRSALGLDEKDEATPEPEQDPTVNMTEEEKIEYELDQLQDKEAAKRKRERRKKNEVRQKEIIRMQLGMLNPVDIGIEAAQVGSDSLFNLKDVAKSGQLETVAKGKMNVLVTNVDPVKEIEEIEIGENSDEDADRLEDELDVMYDQYQQQRAQNDANYRAKKAREEHPDSEWAGFEERQSESGGDDDDDDDGVQFDEDYQSSSESESEDDQPKPKNGNLLTTLENDNVKINGLSKTAHNFFGQSLFKDIDGLDSGSDSDEAINKIVELRKRQERMPAESDDKTSDKDDKTSFEIVKEVKEPKQKSWSDDDDDSGDDDNDDGDNKEHNGPNIDIITAEAMTLAHQLALKEKRPADVIDDSYNRYSLRDRDGLPQWFLDDEDRFSKPNRPITAEAVAAIKAKLRALNARPIKKVEEARARKKMKASRKLERLRKKSDIIIEDPNKSEKEKAESIQKLMRKATKKTAKPQVKVVVARGANRGIMGRPKGVKGRYKMVDGRMKKEMRALKRKAK